MIDKHLFKSQEKRPKEDQSTPNGGEKIDTEVIHVIVGGFAVRGPTMQGNKNYHRSLSQVMVSEPSSHDPFPEVMICEKNRGRVQTPHDESLVVEMKITRAKVQRILIDLGSSSNIISYDSLTRLKYDDSSLEPVHHPIIGLQAV